AQAAHSLTLTNPQQKLAALEDAVKRAPNETRYLVALGACRLSQGNAPAAFADFQKADELSPGDKLATRAFAVGLLANERAHEAADLLKQNSAESRDENNRRLAAISDWLAGNEIQVGSTTSQSLLLGLSHLAKNDEQAQTVLATLPAIDHNPTRNEAALLATQFFYCGVANFQAQHYREAVADWREARRLAKGHKLTLPWIEKLTAYYHRIAERAWAEDLPVAIECWNETLVIAPTDKIAANNLLIARRAQAHQAWQQGQIEQAATIWRELLKGKPADEALLQNAALACEKLGRKDEALDHWRALAKVWRQQIKQRAAEPGFKDRLNSLQQRVLGLMKETGAELEQVLNELEASLRLEPDDQALLLQIAEVLMEIGKPQKSLKYLDQIERQRGASAILLAHKAQALDMSGNPKAAQKAFRQAMEMEPENRLPRMAYINFLGREADDAIDNEKTDRAIEFSEEQLRIDPNHTPALGRLAAIYFEVGRKTEGKALLKRAIETNPDKPQPYVAAGGVYWKFKLKKEAKAVFAKAVELDSSAECLFQIGLAYLMSCEHKEAVKCFDRAAPTAPFELMMEMGMELFEHGEKKDARRFTDQAKKINPTDPMPYLINGMMIVGRNPLELMMATDKQRSDALKELTEAERLMAGRREYDSVRNEIGQIRKVLEETPSGLLGALGGLGGGLPPFLLGDEDDDFFSDDDPGFFPPAPKRKKKKR
ncbi:MAG: tetratricopeptide repeat protein, partial [Acidobacteriota bacterium]